MKKLHFIALFITASLIAHAYDFKVGDLAYNYVPGDSTKVYVTYTSIYTNQNDPDYSNYYGLTAANIPATVKYKGKTRTVTGLTDQAFHSSNIETLSLPSTIKYIGDRAFHGCYDLKRVDIGSLAAWLNIEFVVGSGTIYYENSTPLCYDAVLYINGQPIGDEVVIPSSITAIKPLAFYHWREMKSIKFHKNVKKVGRLAFYQYDNLEAVIVPDIETWINLETETNPLQYAKHLYINDQEVKNLVIPESITELPIGVFQNCLSIESVTFHHKLTTIGICAFQGCKNLTSVTIPYSVTDILRQAFYSCDNLSTVYMESYTPIEYKSSFSGSPTIYVPSRHVNDYRKAEGWKKHAILPWDPFPGDLNEDYEVNTGDVSTLYDSILTGKDAAYCDLNGDGAVNTGDVSALYKMILGQ